MRQYSDKYSRVHALIAMDDKITKLDHGPISFRGRDDSHRLKAVEGIEGGGGRLPTVQREDALRNIHDDFNADLKRPLDTMFQKMVVIQPRGCHFAKRTQPRDLIVHDREFLQYDAVIFHGDKVPKSTRRVKTGQTLLIPQFPIQFR